MDFKGRTSLIFYKLTSVIANIRETSLRECKYTSTIGGIPLVAGFDCTSIFGGFLKLGSQLYYKTSNQILFFIPQDNQTFARPFNDKNSFESVRITSKYVDYMQTIEPIIKSNYLLFE